MNSVEEVIKLYNNGDKLKYLFFWGHRQKRKEQVDQSCFSNWFPSAFSVDKIIYKTAEHYMMAQKAILFKDDEHYKKIVSCNTPGEAKKLGRLVRSFDEEIWKKHRFSIVVEGCQAKFSQNEDFKRCLLQTGAKILVEASPYDRIWGIGMSAKEDKVYDPNNWKGLNLLGFALMQVRSNLICEH
ncbi:NADAR family protein [Candidatus Uabimicrobium sp. HlEnr_7]|uniref:NADAR family protein n=1 Tax=Candidatus Uabimicrobium helgolandensis TaxID=3095367 RepID=UPI003558C2B6